jgi:type IV pilus assembly protein PilO
MNLREIDINTMSAWPTSVKRTFLGALYIILLMIGYWLDISQQQTELHTVKATEMQLREKFEAKQQSAANLEAYIEQLNTIKAYFHTLLRQLPGSTEVPGLVEDISHIGLANGLTFRSIKLQPEKGLEFYSELPIDIAVSGQYHQLAKFVSDLALLPRIVTLHDFTIKNENKESDGSRLVMTVTAKTYRYTAEEDHKKDQKKPDLKKHDSTKAAPNTEGAKK